MRGVGVAIVVVSAACRFRHGAAAGARDSVVDEATPLGLWGTPTMVAITPAGDDDPTLTGDLLELYFNRASNIYVTTRASLAGAWATPGMVAELSSGAETTPEITYDGLTIFISSGRAGGAGGNDIYVATRSARGDVWSTPLRVATLSSPVTDDASAPTTDLLAIVLTPNGGADLAQSTRSSNLAAWATPALITELNTTSNESDPFLTDDKLTLYFDSNRGGNADLYVAHRASPSDPFDAPAPIAELDTASGESDPWVSADGRHIFFTSDRGGSSALWEASR